MKTVRDYKQLGLVFIQGDYINTHEGKKQDPLNRHGVCYCNSSMANDEKFAIEFAWRNNDGVKPEYKGMIEVELKDGTVMRPKKSSELMWTPKLSGFSETRSIVKWRPVVLQSESPTVSLKEDKQMKPIYTAEMHAKGELPQVGSEVKVCIEESGFGLDGDDSGFEGKTVKVKASFINEYENKIVAIENDEGDCTCYIIECIKPITKTIKVNGFDVPAPMSEAPERGTKFYNPSFSYHDYFDVAEWIGDSNDNMWLSRGLAHSTKSAAIAHAKAMLGIDPND